MTSAAPLGKCKVCVEVLALVHRLNLEWRALEFALPRPRPGHQQWCSAVVAATSRAARKADSVNIALRALQQARGRERCLPGQRALPLNCNL